MKQNRLIILKAKIRKTGKEHKVCLAVFGILSLLWAVNAVYMKYAPFGVNSLLMNDAIHQYYPLFGQYRDRLLSGEGILYSASGGLGFNFYALWTYYLSSPLNLLVIFFPVSQIDSAMNLLIIFKILLSGMTFAYYLERKGGRGNYTIVPFACGYALSTFVLGYCYNIMWMDCLALFPVILDGLENLLEKGKWKQYVISLALCLWCSFYISFIICLFLVIWFLFYKHPSIQDFFKKGIKFALSSILSAGLASIVLLPAYLGIVQMQGHTVFPEFDWMGEFSEIFAGKEGGIFAFSDPMSLNNELSYNANLYCGVFVLSLTILFFLAKDIQMLTKIKAAWLLLLFVLSFNNQALNFIWHGFHYQVGIPNRFAFLMLFLLLLLSFEAFQRIKEFKSWQILLSGILSCGVYGILYFLQPENITMRMLVCTLVLACVYTGLQLFYRQEEKSDLFKKLLLCGMCLELSSNAIAGSKTQVGVEADVFYRCKADLQKIANSLEYDQFRTELSNPTVKNEGMAYNLRGTGIFSSMVNVNTMTLLHNIGFSTSSNSYICAGATPVINTLFGIKNYLIIGGDSNRLDYRYEKTDSIGEAELYQNGQVLPVAYLTEDSTQNWSSMKADFFVNQQELIKLMTGEEYKIFTEQPYELVEANDVQISSLDEYQQFTYLAPEGNRNDHAIFEAVAEEDKDLYIRLQAKNSSKTAILVNDEVIAYKDLSSSFYHVGNVKRGDKITVQIGLHPDGPTYGMISMSMYAYHQDAMDMFYEDLELGAMEVTEWKEGYVKGTVEVTGDRHTLFTSIPYEKGWSLKVDGKEQKLSTIHNAFLMVELEEGKHEIEFKYDVPGLKIGALTSGTSFCIFMGIVWLEYRRRRKEQTGVGKANGNKKR